jgi:20S proteasome alpha/beta subunit
LYPPWGCVAWGPWAAVSNSWNTLPGAGRLFQVEYAMSAIDQSGLAVGILTRDGVVLAAEKRMASKLLDTGKAAEKMYKIDDHIAVAVAGITSDANILVNHCRVSAQQYLFRSDEPVPLENLLMTLCDTKQGYTQYGGARHPSPGSCRGRRPPALPHSHASVPGCWQGNVRSG